MSVCSGWPRNCNTIFFHSKSKILQNEGIHACTMSDCSILLLPYLHYVRFSQCYWHFWANLVMHICFMLQVCIIAIWSQGLILNSRRSYATFGTKIPVFRANSGSLLGTKWQKWWIYKNVSRIVKIVHSALAFEKQCP